jgi:hypothetical protein
VGARGRRPVLRGPAGRLCRLHQGVPRAVGAYYTAPDESWSGEHVPEPPEHFLDPLDGSLIQIRIFGTKEAVTLAVQAHNALSGGMFDGQRLPYDVLEPLEAEIRRDLSIPDP